MTVAKYRNFRCPAGGIAARLPAPDWVIERGLNCASPPVSVHTGHCRMSGKRVEAVAQATAHRALAEGVATCTHCRPDSALGFVDGQAGRDTLTTRCRSSMTPSPYC
ncbi:DUF6233 domain-containing protein [Streptomyces sp. NPDC047017]|uniref:DUF6233 domain-containing protein n=1 Tax=Streptomyces sp. NPDC047017 TaxID=3155024 RepID=UPI0033F70474